MAISPNKASTRLAHLPDPISVKLPDSPEKTRTIRKLQSHSQLSSHQPSLISQQRSQRTGLASKPSREQLTSTSTSLPSRARANSDAPIPFQQLSRAARRPPVSAAYSHLRKSSLEVTLKDGPPNGDVSIGLSQLRHSILTSRVSADKQGMSDYRIYLWLALLNIPPLATDEYLALVHRGRSPAYEKISNDVFRTLPTDMLFKRRVTDASLTRVLNATAWKLHDMYSLDNATTSIKARSRSASPVKSKDVSLSDDLSPCHSLYVQGMNVISAPFLYASRSETEAFALFSTFITRECPGYINSTMSGVHRGVALVEKILAIINPTLSSFLLSKNLPASLYAFPSVETFCACTAPLPEVLHLWDFLFAYGPHLNIICIVAQLLLLKDTLLASQSPGKLLRAFPALNAEEIIKMTLLVTGQIPDDVYAEVVIHAR